MAPSDDDPSELLDDPFDDEGSAPEEPVLLLDETEDGLGAAGDLDAGETGDAILGETGEGAWAGDDTGPGLGAPTGGFAADRVPLAAEEAAIHIVEPDAG